MIGAAISESAKAWARGIAAAAIIWIVVTVGACYVAWSWGWDAGFEQGVRAARAPMGWFWDARIKKWDRQADQ